MANLEHLQLVKQDVEEWEAWRRGRRDITPDLSEADLSEAVLCGADLHEADLSGAVLCQADLAGAVLTGADLS